jgi:hypothetical protein
MQSVPQQHSAGASHTTSLVDHPPPQNIAQRRELRNFESRDAPTDFETWQQAENALGRGHSVRDIVHREIARNFGGAEVQCVPPLLAVVSSVWRCAHACLPCCARRSAVCTILLLVGLWPAGIVGCTHARQHTFNAGRSILFKCEGTRGIADGHQDVSTQTHGYL